MVVALLAALSIFASQQTPVDAPDPSATDLGDIVVDGRRVEEAVRSFVEEIGAPPRGTRPARWHLPVCVSVSGARSDAAQFVIDRVASHALALGLDVGEPGCRPNVIVFMSADGAALGDQLVRQNGSAFQVSLSSSNLGVSELGTFRTGEAPVRWWTVSKPVIAESGRLAVNPRGPAIDGMGPPAIEVHDVSRIRSNVRNDMAWTIIVVDMSKTGGVPLGALSDYISMVALAQIDADAELTRYPSILNLFKERAPVTALTDWDTDYLKALYTSREDRATVRQQESDLVHALLGEHRASQAAASE